MGQKPGAPPFVAEIYELSMVERQENGIVENAFMENELPKHVAAIMEDDSGPPVHNVWWFMRFCSSFKVLRPVTE